jgi:myo-inositol-1(or 4)-monophosphatase
MNDRRLRVSRREHLRDALVGTGFPYREIAHLDEYLRMLKGVTQNSAGVRRAGSAALDLAYVAAGRLDGFWELGLSAWDMAAGSLLIFEAGGLVSDLDGEANYLDTGHVVSGTPKVFVQLLQVVQAARDKRVAPA